MSPTACQRHNWNRRTGYDDGTAFMICAEHQLVPASNMIADHADIWSLRHSATIRTTGS